MDGADGVCGTAGPLAARWLDGTAKVAPRDLVLDGRRLRLWVAAAGSWDGQRAYLLRLAPSRPYVPEEDDGEAGGGTDVAEVPVEEEQAVAPQAGVVPAADPPDEELIEDLPEAPRGKPKKRAAPLISTFDPGPVDLGEEAEDWIDDNRDGWPDSGVGDLPTVDLDPLAEVAAERLDVPDENDNQDEHAIDRQVADNWVAIGDALATAGLIAVFVGPKAGGPAYRIVGLRRVTRLAELVGEPPRGRRRRVGRGEREVR
ncbi:hypothetical protein [Dactylosporangium cerinum]